MTSLRTRATCSPVLWRILAVQVLDLMVTLFCQ
jgi:hypothetical protein